MLNGRVWFLCLEHAKRPTNSHTTIASYVAMCFCYHLYSENPIPQFQQINLFFFNALKNANYQQDNQIRNV